MRFIVKLMGGAALKCVAVPEPPFYNLYNLIGNDIVSQEQSFPSCQEGT